jgi:hypothetical protein
VAGVETKKLLVHGNQLGARHAAIHAGPDPMRDCDGPHRRLRHTVGVVVRRASRRSFEPTLERMLSSGLPRTRDLEFPDGIVPPRSLAVVIDSARMRHGR